MNNYPEIQELLHRRADLYARLNLLPYDGTPEIKETKAAIIFIFAKEWVAVLLLPM